MLTYLIVNMEPTKQWHRPNTELQSLWLNLTWGPLALSHMGHIDVMQHYVQCTLSCGSLGEGMALRGVVKNCHRILHLYAIFCGGRGEFDFGGGNSSYLACT